MSPRPEILTALCVMLCSALWLSWLAAAAPQTAKLISGPLPAPQSQVEVGTKTVRKTLDACSLLTGGEIAAVLGEPLQELKPGTQESGHMNMSHCLFITRDFVKSASLSVATPSTADSGAGQLRSFWRQQFHSSHKQEEDRQPASRKGPAAESAFQPSHDTVVEGPPSHQSNQENEAEEAARKPRPISALGEEAFWVGSPLSGALYVLQGDLFLRISVGGVPKESARIAKSKSLATAILVRLRQNPN